MKTLFPYQRDAKSAINKALRQRLPAALVIMATGLGKTVVAASFVQWWTRQKNGQILFLVHLWEAIEQAEKEFREMLEPNAKFQLLSGNERLDKDADVVFSTFQTMRNRYRSMQRHAFGLIVVDECHRSKASTYEPIVEYFRPQFKLAMTATEERMDGRDVRELFGEPVYEYSLARALANHNLADVEYRVLVDNISQASLRHIENLLGCGEGAVTRAMIDRKVFLKERLTLIARTIKKEQKTRRKTIIFCNSRKHAIAVNEHFPEGQTYFSGLPRPILEERLSDFKAGVITTLIVVNKLNEAVDIPDADLIVFLRMTESKTIWLQQLGRGLRKKEGKHNVLVLDFVANCDRIRVVGQLASGVRKCLGITRESTEIHRSGLIFQFEAEARNIMALLERLEKLPQAGPDGTFELRHEIWGTISGLAAILKFTDPTIAKRIALRRVREMLGKDSNGALRKFYPLSKVRDAFGKELKIPKIDTEVKILEVEGESWGTIYVLAPMIGLSVPTIENRGGSCRKRYGLVNGKIATFYALSDVRKACADLLKEMPKAGQDQTFKLQRETWGTAKAIGKIIGASEYLVRRNTPIHLTREAKGWDGNVYPFYPLSKARKACSAFTKKVPQARKDGTFVKDRHRWATLNTLTGLLGITWRAIKTRTSSCRKMKGKDQYGVPAEFYSVSEAKKACADLLKPLPRARKDGTFKLDGEVWGILSALARILGLSEPSLKSRAGSCRAMNGKSFSGIPRSFYALSDMRKACKKVRRRKKKRK